MPKIIGLDLSLRSSGWCKIDTENGARTFDTLKHPELTGMKRIDFVAREIVDLCRTADFVVMEGLSMGMPAGKNGHSFVPQGRNDLVGMTYIIRLWLWKTRKRTVLVTPACLKKFASGKGNNPKSVMIHAVSQRWKVEVADDNQADAIALAEFGRAYLNHDDPLAVEMELPDFQKECLPKAEELFEVVA